MNVYVGCVCVCVKESQLLQWSRSDGKTRRRGWGEEGGLALPSNLYLLKRQVQHRKESQRERVRESERRAERETARVWCQ